jgi:hypothetical protein
MKLPAFLEPFVFGALLSGLMSFIVSGIATCNAVGFVPTFTMQWLESWLFAWAVAFPTVLIVAPAVRRLTQLVVAPRPTTFAAK